MLLIQWIHVSSFHCHQVTYIQRDTVDPTNVDLEFYMSENGTVQEPAAASAVYSTLSLGRMSAEMGVEV